MPKGHPFATVEESIAARRASWAAHRARNLEKERADDRARAKAIRSTPEGRAKHLAAMKRWREDPRTRQRALEAAVKTRLKYRLRCIVRCIRNRCTKLGIPYDHDFMTAMSETRPESCPCCKNPLDYMSQKRTAGRTPSFDRVNPQGGYVSGNVIIICWRCNDLKRNGTVSELEAVLAYMKEHGCP